MKEIEVKGGVNFDQLINVSKRVRECPPARKFSAEKHPLIARHFKRSELE